MEVAFKQLAFRQPFPVSQGLQAPAPLQVPELEQSPLEASLALHRFLGSAPPEGTRLQVPILPRTLQLLHRPSLASLQALSQHTPSVQMPLAHSTAPPQGKPFGLSPHDPCTQVLGLMQSLSLRQGILQSVPSQMKVPHVRSSGVTQAPAPSQVDSGVTEDMLAQTPSLQWVPLSVYAQAPPLHVPVVPHDKLSLATHLPCGSRAPSATVEQRPNDVTRLQAMHAPVQLSLQHTPWAQKPVPHSLPPLHFAPGGRRPHEPPSQLSPGAH